MKHGAIVVVATRGAYTGKPQPAVVVQSDLFNPTHASLTLWPSIAACGAGSASNDDGRRFAGRSLTLLAR